MKPCNSRYAAQTGRGALRVPLVMLALFLMAPGLSSVVHAQQSLEQSYEAKLQKEFLKKVAWQTTLADAGRESKKRNLPILAYFTRSFAP